MSVRKNSRVLFEAFSRMCRTHRLEHALVLAGTVDRAAVDEFAGRADLDRHLIIVGPVPDTTLAQWYRHAAAVCVPSRYEGFGLPVVEAMASGAPVVISSSPALEEVAGGAAAIFEDRDDPDALADALAGVLTLPSLAARLRARGLERSREFTWDRCVSRHVEVYEQMVDGG
jgi:glycosyltransferase involved in cell wall biosynthesis